MNLHGIRELVASSSPDDWHAIDAPVFLEYSWLESGRRQGLDAHGVRATFKPDVHLGVACGLKADDGPELWRPDWTSEFADRTARPCLADVFWCGALIDREMVGIVDGGRAILPVPDPFAVNIEVVAHTVTAWQRSLARVVHCLRHHAAEFDSYFDGAGFVVVD